MSSSRVAPPAPNAVSRAPSSTLNGCAARNFAGVFAKATLGFGGKEEVGVDIATRGPVLPLPILQQRVGQAYRRFRHRPCRRFAPAHNGLLDSDVIARHLELGRSPGAGWFS